MSCHLDEHLQQLERAIVACRLCPRLVNFREGVSPRASFRSEEYWRKPIPGFGDVNAQLMLIGLAPAAHGGNRTGRLFTGDESARFLMRALYVTGLANQATSSARDDGLQLNGCYITAAVRCVPPDNKPSPAELRNCRSYLEREFQLLTHLRVVVALGGVAFKAYLDFVRSRGHEPPATTEKKFAHGIRVEIPHMPCLYGSYHPSPRNTYTGRLTERMLVEVLQAAKDTCAEMTKKSV